MRMKMNEQMTYPGLNWKARGAGAVRFFIFIRSCFEYQSHKILTNLQVFALVLQSDEVTETDGREGDECVVERVDQRPAFLQNRMSVKELAQSNDSATRLKFLPANDT